MKRVNKYIMEGLLTFPGIIFLVFPVIMGMWGEKTWKKLLIHSGFVTISLLIFSLVLSPLNRLFPKVSLLKFFNRFRREIGLSVFFYACFHFFFYLMRSIEKRGWVDPRYIFHPVIFTGLCTFLILLLLAITSNDWSMKKMGYRKWKWVHRLIYLGEITVFIHVFLKSPFYAYVLILPLVCVQFICFAVTKKRIA